MTIDIQAIQSDLRAARFDGWLFYDFRGRDPIAQNILKLPQGMRTRRWFYFVPAKGAPKKLVHKIESQSLAALPGETLYYAGLDEIEKSLRKILARTKTIAMTSSRNTKPAGPTPSSAPTKQPAKPSTVLSTRRSNTPPDPSAPKLR
jgi:hypothetical protein